MQEECVHFVSATRDGMIDPVDRIGFGRYQWQLFVLCGLGWLADSETCLLAPGTRADMTQRRPVAPGSGGRTSASATGVESVSHRVCGSGRIRGNDRGCDYLGCLGRYHREKGVVQCGSYSGVRAVYVPF